MVELIGQQFGQYTIVEKIGEGGMAVVYKGYQESLNRYVAVKVLRVELARDQEFIGRFRREALSVAKLNHPNILHVYDAGMAHGVYYIVMDYADGGSLKDLLQRGPLESKTAVAIATQLAEALDYAHRQGLVHRDVKSSNVLLTRDGRPLLTDFGIAKVLHGSTQLTRSGTSIGTPEYMAPEQLQGQSVDGRTDIYALGIVIFEMLSGWLPFSAPTPMAVMYRQMNEPPPPLRQVNITTPAWLEEVVDQALAKQPEDRFRTAGELANALRQGSGTAVSAPADRPRAKAPAAIGGRAATRPAQKGPSRGVVPILLVAIAILVIALSAAAAYLALGGSEPKASPAPVLLVVTPQAAADTAVPAPTSTATASPEPTPEPVIETETALPADTAVVVVVTATPLPQSPIPTSQPTAMPTMLPTATPEPSPTLTQVPIQVPTQVPTRAPALVMEPGVITDFESFGTWRRGDEPNGTFSQSNVQAHQGSYSGRLDYSFPTAGNDYVVFQQSHSIADKPTRMTAWVYGDGSGHFLNAWIKEAGGQVWQVPMGAVTHSGWQQMAGIIDATQDWPWTHISGPDNGVVDYPISFLALVLDDKPDPYTGSGTLYVDDLRADSGTAAIPSGPTPPQPQAGQPTAAPRTVSGISGRIAYSAGGALHIVNAQTGQDTVAPIGGMFQADLRNDGKLIIANGEGGGKTSLWTIDANGGAFIREQSPFTNDFRPFWAPDGGQFVYDSLHHGGQFRNDLILYKQTLDSRQDQVLEHGGQAILGSSPVWMQDDWVAFTACDYWPGGTGGSRCGLYRMPSWGGQPALILAGALTMRATDNHGAQLLFMSQEGGNWEVYVIPTTGGTARNLSNSAGSNDGLATFSPNGQTVAFVSNRGGNWAVWAVGVGGGSPTKLFDLPAPPADPSGDWTQERMSWGP